MVIDIVGPVRYVIICCVLLNSDLMHMQNEQNPFGIQRKKCTI